MVYRYLWEKCFVLNFNWKCKLFLIFLKFFWGIIYVYNFCFIYFFQVFFLLLLLRNVEVVYGMFLIFVDVNGLLDVEVVWSFDVSMYLLFMFFFVRVFDFMIIKFVYFFVVIYCGFFLIFLVYVVIVKMVVVVNNLSGFIFIFYWVY